MRHWISKHAVHTRLGIAWTVLVILMAGPSVNAANAETLFVGVLEVPQCDAEVGTVVRPLFAKDKGKWRTLYNPSREPGCSPLWPASWNVAFDGRTRGTVKTWDTRECRATVGRPMPFMKLLDGQGFPQIANDRAVFGGWCEVPTTRPLVVVSQPHYRDPDRWRRLDPDRAARDHIFPHFERAISGIQNCASIDQPPVPFAIEGDALAPLIGYQDRRGRRLIGIGLDPKLNRCDGPPDDQWKPQWFLVDEGVRHVGVGMSLVDAGDYDEDGTSEVIFWYSGYNKDGYILFDGGFEERVEHLWNYH